MTAPYSSPWYLDKKIAITFVISLIGSLLVNSGALIWAASKYDDRLILVEQKSSDLMIWKDKADDQRTRLELGLGILTQNVSDNTKILDHIQNMLEKHMDENGRR